MRGERFRVRLQTLVPRSRHTGLRGSRDIGGEGVQQGLLKLLEGREIFVPLDQVSSLDGDAQVSFKGNAKVDIGRFKGPILRGLAARAPYFHNGSAASLSDAVDFYDQRFGIGFTEAEINDLIAFLRTL